MFSWGGGLKEGLICLLLRCSDRWEDEGDAGSWGDHGEFGEACSLYISELRPSRILNWNIVSCVFSLAHWMLLPTFEGVMVELAGCKSRSVVVSRKGWNSLQESWANWLNYFACFRWIWSSANIKLSS